MDNMENYRCQYYKAILGLEINIFRKLRKFHKEANHPNDFIYLCAKCNEYCVEIMDEFLAENGLKDQKLENESIVCA